MDSFNGRFLTILFIIFINVTSSAQSFQNDYQKNSQIIFEKNIIPKDSSFVCYLSFRLPINELIFINDGNEYTSGVTIDFELKNDDKIFDRLSLSKNVIVKTYEETIAKDKYLQGLINLERSKNFYLIPYLKIANTESIIKLDSIRFDFAKISNNPVGHPIIVENNVIICDDRNTLSVSNYQNAIPYSSQLYNLLFPINKLDIGKIKVIVEQDNKTIIEDSIETKKGSIKLIECNNKISAIIDSTDIHNSYLVVNNINHKLSEGNIKIKFLIDNKEVKELYLRVNWFNKPKSLYDLNTAIEMIGLIDSKEKVNDLLKGNDEEKERAFFNYWNKIAPNRSTDYNPLMAEFYNRIDYAYENYSTLTNQNGAKTDRGKIYIKYGKPDLINRDYSSDNTVYEIWTYNEMNKEFMFMDESGLGNYILSN